MIILKFSSFLFICLSNIAIILFELVQSWFQFFAIVLQLRNFLSCSCSLLLSHQRMAHTICNRTVIKFLISRQLRTELISDSHQKKSPLCTI
jgi:hypothetical protein